MFLRFCERFYNLLIYHLKIATLKPRGFVKVLKSTLNNLFWILLFVLMKALYHLKCYPMDEIVLKRIQKLFVYAPLGDLIRPQFITWVYSFVYFIPLTE